MNAILEAQALLPASVKGAAPSGSLVEKAADLLKRIKAGLATSFDDPRTRDPSQPKPTTLLRKAAAALAQGAQEAATFAREVKDDVARDLSKLAVDAWSVAAGPLLILGLLYVLTKD